jgi:hypothetical protein
LGTHPVQYQQPLRKLQQKLRKNTALVVVVVVVAAYMRTPMLQTVQAAVHNRHSYSH